MSHISLHDFHLLPYVCVKINAIKGTGGDVIAIICDGNRVNQI